MISLKTENLDSVVGDLSKLGGDIAEETRATLLTVGRVVQSEAIQRTPVSPTKAQAQGDPNYRFDPKKSPKELQNSIEVRRGQDYVDVGIMQGPAMAYADIIHNKQGTAWKNIGPGSRAKQGRAKVGGKFIDRAYDDNKDKIDKMFRNGVNHAIEKF